MTEALRTEHKRHLGLTLIAIGAVMVATALWGGAYMLHLVTIQDWKAFPMIMTTIAVGVGGLMLCGYGAYRVSYP